MLILFSGLSGSGKDTIIQSLLATHANFKYFRSATTRPPRDGEDNYIFLTPSEFEKQRLAGAFYEVENVHGHWYGTLRSEVEKIAADQHNHYVKDIDVHGQKRLKTDLQDKTKILSIFLEVPNEILQERLRARGETEARIAVRLSRGELERSHKQNYDVVIENINLAQTLQQIEKEILKRLEK